VKEEVPEGRIRKLFAIIYFRGLGGVGCRAFGAIEWIGSRIAARERMVGEKFSMKTKRDK
jgi:hypothetical protein